ncbi:MAG: YcgN family cysteine cluster protein [Alphaproteobacteria bacterium]|nr:YcgN family cysteine cluster protein [Alphaproteobacteria bacterium]
MTTDSEAPFWRRKKLSELSASEWELLCDGCGKCCLVKLGDGARGVDYTDVACRLLNTHTCRCRDYEARQRLVADCVVLTSRNVRRLNWMPSTCAYRLVAEGKDLYWWHHLISGSKRTIHEAGMSVRGRVISEREAGDPAERIVRWPA